MLPAACRTAESSWVRGRRTARSDKSSEELATEQLCNFEASSVADRKEIGVDQEGGRQLRFLAREVPEPTPEVNVALGIGFEHQLEDHLGIDGLGVEGGRGGAQMDCPCGVDGCQSWTEPFSR